MKKAIIFWGQFINRKKFYVLKNNNYSYKKKVIFIDFEKQNDFFKKNDYIFKQQSNQIFLDKKKFFYIEVEKYESKYLIKKWYKLLTNKNQAIKDFFIFSKIGKSFEEDLDSISNKKVISLSENHRRKKIIYNIQNKRFEELKKLCNDDENEIFDKINENYKFLAKIKGITLQNAKEIHNSIQKCDLKSLILKFNQYGLSLTLLEKIKYFYFKNKSIDQDDIKKIEEKLFKNPYEIFYSIKDVYINEIDYLATIFNHPLNSNYRKKAFIYWRVEKYIQKYGHTFVESLWLFNEKIIKKKFGNEYITLNNFFSLITELIKEKKLAINFHYNFNKTNWLITLYHINLYENTIVNKIKLLNNENKIEFNEKNVIMKSIFFDSIQKKAILNSLNSNISIISGPPGSGKTTIIQEIVKNIEKIEWKIYQKNQNNFNFFDFNEYLDATLKISTLAAKASENINSKNKDYKIKATTIHKLLGFNGTKFSEIKDENIKYIIIDEASMIDIFILYHLLKNAPNLKKIIFIGDKEQLQPIGPGKPFFDLIDSKKIPITILKENYRQKEGSNIIINSLRFLKNQNFVFNNYDFQQIIVNDKIELNTYLNKIKNDFIKNQKIDLLKIPQILIPIYSEWNGINAINKIFQNFIQKHYKNDSFIINEKKFFINDKVINIENDYKKNIYNGSFGFIKSFWKEQKNLKINYWITIKFNDIEIEFNQKDFIKNIKLAYAISIHKAQGSEFDDVIFFCFKNYGEYMISQELIYTAITRAKKSLKLIHDHYNFFNVKKLQIQTKLIEKLKK